MKKVSIIGLGWLGMPLAHALAARGYQVVGSKSTQDGVTAAKMSGIDCYPLLLTPEIVCQADCLNSLLDVDVLIITLPARRTVTQSDHYFQAVQQLVDSALAHNVGRMVFTSSTSVYGQYSGQVNENSPLLPVTQSGKVLKQLENWFHDLPHTSVDILRLAGLVGPDRHPGRFLAGKRDLPAGDQGVNLVHLEDVIAAILLLLRLPRGGHIYNLCAPLHPHKAVFYTALSHQLGVDAPHFLPGTAASESGKCVDGNRICRELGFEYLYPDPMTMPVN
jgi:nucleoside-diphosphate-sugar epimerase